MKLFFTTLALCFSTLFLIADETGFEPIFNGKDFTDWDFQPGAWKIIDGEFHCTGEAKNKNWLIWRKTDPSNFVLRLEFKWEAGNSGVQVRSDDLGDWQIFGYQVEVARRDVMGLWHHSLLDGEHPTKDARHLMTTAGQTAEISTAGKRTVTDVANTAELQALYEEAEWNTMEIIADGKTLTQKINGEVFATLIDGDIGMGRTHGFIALQDHGKGCQVAFRNLRIKMLP
ncbi:MAG: DUF1080 domain-containing protein [Verrucomicrobiales bacterium]|nr:DUF1080 domain-containing protein [Verrucomicrobiales bacterium]